MKLPGLSVRNATIKWWRSLTLGFFIFSVSLVMIISSSFILAAKNKVEKVIVNGITGHIQIRSDQSMEGDMAVQYNPGWDALKPLNTKTIDSIRGILSNSFPEAKPYMLARQSSYLTNGDKREETMLVGIEPGFDTYKDAFILTGGRYLNPGSSDEILLTEEQAKAFGVKPGDSITVTTKNTYGLNSHLDLKVAGTGNFVMLSLFSYKAAYADINTVRKLSGMLEDEATDMVLFIPDKNAASAYLDKISRELKAAGMKYALSKDERIESDDLKVSELSLDEKDEGGLIISDYSEMGKTFKGVSETMFLLLNILIVFLVVIIGILIINLVYMTGLERFREIGTLRAIGFSRAQVVSIFMGEILSISLVFTLLGTLVSTAVIFILGRSGVTSPIPAFDYIMGKTLNLEIDFKTIAVNFALISGFSLAASFYPAYKACSVDPVQTMRTV